jgi:hypothetical protein
LADQLNLNKSVLKRHITGTSISAGIVSGQKSGGEQSDWNLLNKTLRRKLSVASSRSQGTEKKRVAATPSNVPQLINIIIKKFKTLIRNFSII